MNEQVEEKLLISRLVADIISEVEKQVRSLKRQLAQARRHRRYSDGLSRLEVGLARHDYDEWSAQRSVSVARAADLRSRIDAFGELLERDDGATREARALLASHEKTLAELDEEVAEIDSRARNLADGLLVARERKRAAERRVEELMPEIAGLRSDLEQAREQIQHIEQSLDTAVSTAEQRESSLKERRSELKRIDREYWDVKKALARQKQTRLEGLESSAGTKGELESYRARLDDLMEEHADLETALAEARAELSSRESGILVALEEENRFMSAARDSREAEKSTENDLDIAREALLTAREGKTRAHGELEAAQHKLVLLKEMRDGYGGFAAGVRALLTDRSHELRGLRGTVADVIEVDPLAAAAIEVALADAAQYVVVNNRGDALRALEHLSSGERGRATFVPLDEVARVTVRQTPESVLASPDVLGAAASFVRCADELRPVVELLLEGTVVVRDLDAAVQLAARQGTRGLIFVTSKGEAVSAEGLLSGGGGGSAEVGLLRRKERVAEAEREVARLKQLLVDTTSLEAEAKDALARLTSRSRECGERTEQAEADLWEAKRRLTELELARTSAAERVEELSLRRDALGDRMSGARKDIETLAERFKAAGYRTAAFVGNPLVAQIDEFLSSDWKPLPWKSERRIALLPGSRGQEIERILPSLLAAGNYPRLRQALEYPLYRPQAQPGTTHYLSQIERLVRVPIQQREHGAAGLAEQNGSYRIVIRCNHNGYNREEK